MATLIFTNTSFPTAGFFESRWGKMEDALDTVILEQEPLFDEDRVTETREAGRYLRQAQRIKKSLPSRQGDKATLFASVFFRKLKEESFAELQPIIAPYFARGRSYEFFDNDLFQNIKAFFNKITFGLANIKLSHTITIGHEMPITLVDEIMSRTFFKYLTAIREEKASIKKELNPGYHRALKFLKSEVKLAQFYYEVEREDGPYPTTEIFGLKIERKRDRF